MAAIVVDPIWVTVLDGESTGTNETKHEFTEVGMIRLNVHTLETAREMHFRIEQSPEKLANLSANELAFLKEYNGFDPNGWGGLSKRKAFNTIKRFAAGTRLAGWNVSGFDRRFLRQMERDLGDSLGLDYHELDFAAVALNQLREVTFPKFSLDAVGEYFGLPKEPKPHTALGGCKHEIEVIRCLRRHEQRRSR